MAKKLDKKQEIINLSDEILSNFELGDASYEKIMSKCKRLARLNEDYEALKWFTLELHGYDNDSLPVNISKEDADRMANDHGRRIKKQDPVTKQDVWWYWTPSIVEMETNITAHEITLKNLRPPEQFTPAITNTGRGGILDGATILQESYRNVLDAVNIRQNNLIAEIKQNKALLSKVINNAYNYVLNVNLQLKFSSEVESSFQRIKDDVDKKLQKICPSSIKKFLAAYDRIESDNPEEWSQAMSSCRNILKDFANSVFPAQDERYKESDGDEIPVTDDKYENRIVAFIDMKCNSERKNELLKSRALDLKTRVHALNGFLSKGAKNEISKSDVAFCILDTYLLIGSLLEIAEL